MENSPLIFLDRDVSRMLAYQVRLSQEEEARRFHSYIYVAHYELPYDTRMFKVTINRVLNTLGRYWGDFFWDELPGETINLLNYKTTLNRRIILYEKELKRITDLGRKYFKSNF